VVEFIVKEEIGERGGKEEREEEERGQS